MIPEITITCSTGKVFINNITVEQYKKYAALMEKNGSDKITDALFFNKRIIQEIFGNRMSLDELGEVDVIEFLTASKGKRFWSRAPAALSVLKSAARSARFFRMKSSFSATGRTAFIRCITNCPHASAKRCFFTRRSPIFRTEIKSLR